MIKFLKNNAHIFAMILLVLIVLGIVANASYEGYLRYIGVK